MCRVDESSMETVAKIDICRWNFQINIDLTDKQTKAPKIIRQC
jgi:hypothetical protein